MTADGAGGLPPESGHLLRHSEYPLYAKSRHSRSDVVQKSRLAAVSPKSDLRFDQSAPIASTCGLSRASIWSFSDLALAEAGDVLVEIENPRVVDRSKHLSHD
jgi:hypothetical protein